MTTYDVTFNTVDGKSLIKRNVQSDHENARVWEDAVERFDADHLYIKMNDKTMVSLLRRAVVRIDMTELPSDVEKRANRRDEFRNAMYTLSQIGLWQSCYGYQNGSAHLGHQPLTHVIKILSIHTYRSFLMSIRSC